MLLGQQSVSYLERCLLEYHLHRWTDDICEHVHLDCWLQYIKSLMNFSQINIVFQALLVGALQAEDVDQWEMWECQVSKCIDSGTIM